MMDGSAQPTFSFAKFCAQFSHSWKVPVQVNPIRIMAMDSKEKCVCFRLSIRPSFFAGCFLVSVWRQEQEYQYKKYDISDSASVE